MRAFTIVFAYISTGYGFQPPSGMSLHGRCALQAENKGSTEKFSFPNPLSELGDMFQNLDDIIDDFFNKRMGQGEVFYGQRRYKPSNRPNTQGKYNGMGISDKARIDFVRARKEERMEMLRIKREREQAEK